MIKYFKNVYSIYKIDTDKNEIITITNHPENKAIVYTMRTEMGAQSMLDSLTAQLGVIKPGGWVTVETDEAQYEEWKNEIRDSFISGSIGFI